MIDRVVNIDYSKVCMDVDIKENWQEANKKISKWTLPTQKHGKM